VIGAATDEAVHILFSKLGSVEKVSLNIDRDTGRPREFGFAEMSDANASRAMQALNGTEFDGRSLRVNAAPDRGRSGGGNRRNFRPRPCTILPPLVALTGGLASKSATRASSYRGIQAGR
jgi:RNA recognition motif-containing protein